MSLRYRKYLQQLVEGADVIVTWLDSGAGTVGEPGEDVELLFNRTHGRVLSVTKQEEIHALLCDRRCRCHVVELAMCSGGERDTRTEIALIWVDAITDLKVYI